MPARVADIGNVITHVTTMRCAVPHLTPFKRWAEPTPSIDEEITCVVLTGNPIAVAPKIKLAPVKSAATPFTGRIFIIFPPTVLIIFQPPTDVPNPIAVAHESCTQNGISDVAA